jgi:transposase
MLPIGIDISKASFDVAFLDDDKYQNKKFKNNLKDFKNLTVPIYAKVSSIMCIQYRAIL